MTAQNIIFTIIALCLIWLVWRSCNTPTPTLGTTSHSDTVYVIDTTKYQGVVNVTNPVNVIYNEVPVNVDTAAILNKYYATYLYERNYTDSNITLTLFDSISQNKPKEARVAYRLLRPDKIITNTITNTVERNITLLRPTVGFNYIHNVTVVPELGLQYKDRFNMAGGYDFLNRNGNLRVSYTIGR
jgi:hypothetical protein